ncbi:hypothetical protein MNBD_PLANCTO03-996, partial [hydrothermal vent metagenome]
MTDHNTPTKHLDQMPCGPRPEWWGKGTRSRLETVFLA